MSYLANLTVKDVEQGPLPLKDILKVSKVTLILRYPY